MKCVGSTGNYDYAYVYIVEFDNYRCVECVESVQPPIPRSEKWVLLVSTLFGCPVGCNMCDAGLNFRGSLTKKQILDQIDFMVDRRYPDRRIHCRQFKIQFARMGEPALNPSVIQVLEELTHRYQAPGLMPSISTIAPSGSDQFFKKLQAVKKSLYAQGHFQLQFSIHTTDIRQRDRIIPIKKWSFQAIADYGNSFYEEGDRKTTLNFALENSLPVSPNVLLQHFTPDRFLIKLTPINPTHTALKHGLSSAFSSGTAVQKSPVVAALQDAGYDVIVSIGQTEENRIGSNCGQYVMTHLKSKQSLIDGYTYSLTNR